MEHNTFQFETVGGTIVGGWPPVVLRAIVALILTPAAVWKFTLYADRVARFTEYGIPAPELMVIVVGVVEVLAVLMIFFGAAGRLGALVMVPVMVTAMVTTAPNIHNGIVLAGCIAIVLFGTGNLSVWEPFRFSDGAST